MKKILLSIALGTLLSTSFVACNSKEETTDETATATSSVDGTMTVDTAASDVMWEGTMVGLYSHTGTVNLKSGDVTMQDGQITGGNFVVDLTSITPTDKNYKPEEDRTPEKLVGHLSSNDFFNVEQHPTATFEITGSEGNTVMGNLTIRGKTNPEKVENVVVTEENGQVVMTGELTFDRTKYDVSFKHPVQEMVLSNDVAMDVKLVAPKQ
jgi:polyisoprenoid-binding protein YceI